MFFIFIKFPVSCDYSNLLPQRAYLLNNNWKFKTYMYIHVQICIDDAELLKLSIRCKTIQVTEVDESWYPVIQIRDETFKFDQCISREKGEQGRKRKVKDLRGSPWSETPWLGFLHKSWALYFHLSAGASYSFFPFCLWALALAVVLAEWVGTAL